MSLDGLTVGFVGRESKVSGRKTMHKDEMAAKTYVPSLVLQRDGL